MGKKTAAFGVMALLALASVTGGTASYRNYLKKNTAGLPGARQPDSCANIEEKLSEDMILLKDDFETEEAADEAVFDSDDSEITGYSDWAYNELLKAEYNGLVTEHTKTDVSSSNITRFQFAELAANLAEITTGKELEPAPDTVFDDCKEEAVLKAYNAGIVKGVSNTNFRPDELLNRQQLAAMLWRTVEYVQKGTGKGNLKAGGDISGYKDASQIENWAEESVTSLVRNGILNGKSGSRLAPEDICTVEQALLLIGRAYDKL